MSIQLMVELDDKGTPKIQKIESALGKVGKKTDSTGKKWKRNFKAMQSATDKVYSKVMALATNPVGLLGGAGLAGAFTMVTKAGLGFNAQLESIETQYKVITGSAEAARKVMKETLEFSASTPFQMGEVAQARKTLMAFGMSSVEQLEMVGDAAAAAGVPITELAATFGKVASGSNMGEAFNRLAELGLITKPMLEGEGLVFDRQGSYKGTAEDAMAVIARLVKTRFGGMMSEMANTWQGAWSTMKDNFSILAGAMTQPLFEKLKPRIAEITTQFQNIAKNSGFLEFADKMATAVSNAITGFITFAKWVKEAWTVLSYFGEVLGTAAAATMIVVGAVKAWTVAQAIFNAVANANPAVAITTAIVAGLSILIPLINRAVKAVGGWNVVWAYMKGAVISAWQYIKAFFKTVWEGAKWCADVYWNLAEVYGEIWKAIGQTAWDAMKAMVGVIGDAATSIVDMFKNVGTGIYHAITFQFDDMKADFAKVGDAVAAGWSSAVDRVDQIGQGRFDRIGEKIGDLAGAAAKPGFLAAWKETMGEAGVISAAEMEKAKALMQEALASPETSDSKQGSGSRAGGGGGRSGAVANAAGVAPWMAGMAEGYASYQESMALIKTEQEMFQAFSTELWGGYWGDVMDMAQSGFGDLMSEAILSESANLKEALDGVWTGIKDSFVKMTMDMVSQWIWSKIKMKVTAALFDKAITQDAVANAAARVAASQGEAAASATEAAADQSSAAAKTFKAHSGIPFVGAIIAAGLVGLMIATLAKSRARRYGGRQNANEPYLVGEDGPELHIPDGAGQIIPHRQSMEMLRAGTTAPAGSTLNLTINAGGGGGDDLDRDVETDLVPVIERLFRQRRLRLA